MNGIVAGALAVLCGTSILLAGNWPQFRGPSGDGICDASTSLPLQWNENSARWKTPIHGKAWSSPVVWGQQLWMTTATPDGHDLYAVCVDRDSGSIIFDRNLFEIAHPQYCIPFNSYASPTPCIEEGRVYVTFGSPGTACLDTRTASVLWTRTDLVCNHYRGAGSSPLLYKDMLIMNFDGSDHQYVIALDKHTGQTIWRTDRDVDFGDLGPDGKPAGEGDFRKAFSTPRIITVNGRDQLISAGSKALYSYDPANGKEIWRVEVKSSFSSSSTPVFADGLVFFTTGPSATELLAVRPDGKGVVTDTHVAWRTHRHAPGRSSPVVVGDLLYMVSDAGIATCLDARTGKQVWQGRLDGDYSASPISAGGRIYFCSEQGVTTVLEAGREFKILAKNAMGDGFMASPAVSDQSLFLRSRSALYRIN